MGPARSRHDRRCGGHSFTADPPCLTGTSVPHPLGNGLFGGSGSSDVSNAGSSSAAGVAGVPGGYVVLSGPPVSGRAVLVGVAEGSFVAGVLAVVLAAIAGYYLAGACRGR